MGMTAMAAGQIYSGIQKNKADRAAAGQLEEQAGQSIAAGIQAAQVQRLKGAYVESNARAAIAAGGLSTTGTSAVRTQGQILGQAEYNALSAIYQGQSRAQDLNARASTLISEGKAAQISSAISAGTSFYGKYAAGTSPTTTTTVAPAYESDNGLVSADYTVA